MRSLSARAAPVLATQALVVAAACALAVLIAGPGLRLGWWSVGASFQAIRWATIIALVAALLGVVALVLVWRSGTRRGLAAGVAAILVSAAVALPPLAMARKARQVPPIHDITTDTEDPPKFVAVLPLRRGAPNSVEYEARTTALQRQAYPDIAPVLLKLPPAEAFSRAEQAARAMGWEIVAVSAEDRRIEATDTTRWFAFKDDVVIRVSAHPDGSRVDVRSLSRLGTSDLGANAARIRDYVRRLTAP